MEAVTEFFVSDTGQILSILLLVFGLFDVLITRLPFLPLAKQLKLAQDALLTVVDPEQKQQCQQQVNGLNTIKIITTVIGVIMALIGIFGITR